MQRRTPRRLAFVPLALALAALPPLALCEPQRAVPSVPAVQAAAKPSPELAAFLKTKGFLVQDDFSIKRQSDGVVIGRELLLQAGLRYDKNRDLAYIVNNAPVERELLPAMLEALAPFARAQQADPKEVGRQMREWGVPPVFDGKHLLNPDGSATYYGLMFHQGMKDSPGALKHLSGERLAQSLELFSRAYHAAFNPTGSPDLAAADLGRAWGMLRRTQAAPGETLVALKPWGDAGGDLTRHMDAVAAAEQSAAQPGAKADMRNAVTTLGALRSYRYHSDLSLPEVPAPGAAGGLAQRLSPKVDKDPGPEPPQRFLPTVLRVLDKVNGKPLTPEQQEWLIKSFPMGELVWRMQAQELWKDELAAKQDLKIAVIDSGAGGHPDLEPRLKRSENFTGERAVSVGPGEHGTHVAGILAALLGDSKYELNSYRALTQSVIKNGRLPSDGGTDRGLVAAIDKAVADGNQVVNVSLASPDFKSPVRQAMARYSKEKGIIFVVGAGNTGPGLPSALSATREVVTAGALDVNDRVAGFSSFGEAWDPLKLGYEIKKVFLAPGKNIVSTIPGGEYAPRSGTSMATPVLAAMTGWLHKKARSADPGQDPGLVSGLVQGVLERTARPVPRNQLPAEVPADQEFLVVDPVAAYKALRPAPLVAKN